jgi:hypothetical protein
MPTPQKEAREYATKHTPIEPLSLGEPLGTKYADKYMENVGKAGIKRQQRGMADTAAAATASQEATRAARDLGGPRTPPYK